MQAGSDEIILRSSDLDFPVTTDSPRVRDFLAASDAGVRLVFSTDQSAHVVAAGMPPGATFDLAILDEAHKTAGREGAHFGFALSDRHLRIKKRLFLTATPRHYDLRRRDREGDARLVYSMDAPEIYGPVAHQFTFAVAALRDKATAPPGDFRLRDAKAQPNLTMGLPVRSQQPKERAPREADSLSPAATHLLQPVSVFSALFDSWCDSHLPIPHTAKPLSRLPPTVCGALG